MSGISTGSIFFTPAVMALSLVNAVENMVKKTGKIAFAGVIAVHNYNKKQEEKKFAQLSDEMSALDKSVRENIWNQTSAFDNSIEEMINTIAETQKSVTVDIDNSDSEEFKMLLKKTRKNTIDGIEKIHAQFKKNYAEAINRGNAEISSVLTVLKENILSEVNSIEDNIHNREERAAARALGLIEDAKSLAHSLDSDAGDMYIREAESDLGKGNYQSAISLASSAVTEIYMNLYRTDAEEKEKDFYTSSCIFLAAEIRELLDSFKEVEFRISEDSEQIMTGDLTQFMKTEYEDFINRCRKTEDFLNAEVEEAGSAELKKLTESLNEMYSEINEAAADAFYYMIYTLNRTEMEKSVYHLLDEKGFVLSDTKYTDGDPVKSSERKYICPLTGEELTVAVEPYYDEDNDIRTNLTLMSNRSSEEIREQFRKEIVSKLKSDCSNVENVNLKCSEETRNTDARDTGRESAIENPQHIRTDRR